jgi:hypothetical protein
MATHFEEEKNWTQSTDGRTDQRTDGRTDGQTDGRDDGQTDGQAAKCTFEGTSAIRLPATQNYV